MATSSLIFLLFLTTGNLLLTTTAAAPVDDFCRRTENTGRCVALLKGTDKRTPTAGPTLLELIAIEAAQGTAGNARIAVANLATSAKDPKQKINYRNCENSYLDALDGLSLGQENLQKRRIGKLLQTSQVVGSVVLGCAAAIGNTPSLKGANDDTIVLGQVIDSAEPLNFVDGLIIMIMNVSMAKCSSIFLQLLFLTTGNLLLPTIAAPVDDICRKTKEPPRCLTILKATDERTPTAPLPVLEQIAIRAAQGTTGQSRVTVTNLAISAKDPNLKTIYTNCANSYRNALNILEFAAENLQKRRFAEVATAAGNIGRVVGGCAAAVRSNPGLKRGTEDTGVVAEAISIIARNLR